MNRKIRLGMVFFSLGFYLCFTCIQIQPAFSDTSHWVRSIEKNDLKALTQAIRQHPQLATFKAGKTYGEWTLFELALHNENPQIIKRLLKAGGSMQALRNYGENHVSTLQGNMELLKLYLEAGVSPNKISKTYSKMGDYYTLTPFLTVFADTGNLRSVHILANHNVDFDARTFSTYPVNHVENSVINKETALMRAIKNNNMKMAQLLFEKGASPLLTNAAKESARTLLLESNNRYAQPYTPQEIDDRIKLFKSIQKSLAPQPIEQELLLKMAQQGHFELLKEQHEDGASLMFSNAQGVTLLMAAANGGQLEIIKWLIGKGLPTNFVDTMGENALNYAIREQDVKTFKWLVMRTHSTQNVRGKTLLMEAAAHQNIEMIKELIEKKVPLNEQDYKGRTALFYAIQTGDAEDIVKTLQLLLKHGADPHIKDKNNNTLLHAVTQRFVDDSPTFQCKQNTQAADFVLSLRLDTNTQNTLGETALMYGIYSADTSFVTNLLKQGAKPNIQDKNGNTALLHLMNVSCSYEHYYANSKLIHKGSPKGQSLLNTLLQYKADPFIKNYLDESPQMKIQKFDLYSF